MENRKNLTMVTQSLISHLFIRTLCLLIIEYECLQRILEATGKSYQTGNWLLASGFTIAAAICFFYPSKLWGYMIGIGFALFNISVKLYFVIAGHEHYPYWPIVWISQCSVIIYFSVKAMLALRDNRNIKQREVPTPNH